MFRFFISVPLNLLLALSLLLSLDLFMDSLSMLRFCQNDKVLFLVTPNEYVRLEEEEDPRLPTVQETRFVDPFVFKKIGIRVLNRLPDL